MIEIYKVDQVKVKRVQFSILWAFGERYLFPFKIIKTQETGKRICVID